MKRPKVFFEVEQDPAKVLGRTIGHLFISPWLLMWALDVLGHQWHVPFLYWVGYWQAWLIVFALQAVWPLTELAPFQIKEAKKK